MSEGLIINAMADCVFPEEIMLCILARLPVKSLVRFKSVCKPWGELFASPQFVRMHYDQFSISRENQAFIIDRFSNVCRRATTLVSIVSEVNERVDVNLPHTDPFHFSPSMFCLGCCNGVVCMGILFDELELGIAPWNPALRLSKFVPIPGAICNSVVAISLGFGCDSDGDFRAVKIVTYSHSDDLEDFFSKARVYSAKSDTWASIELTFEFRVFRIKNDSLLCKNTIVNGNPYWVARINGIDENDSVTGSDVLVWCDLTKLQFKTVPLFGLELEDVAKVPFVNWRGSLAALMYTKSDARLESLDVWVFQDGDMVWTKNHTVFQDGDMVWTKNHTFEPIEMKVDRCLQCSENGIIMGHLQGGKLFVLDPETRRVKEIEIGEYREDYLGIHGYNESLVCIEGMKQIELVDEDEEMYLEVEEETEDEEEGNQ